MRYETILGTDLKPSVICLGTSSLGSSIEENASFSLLDEFVNLGGNFIDTAHVYANWLPIEKSISEKTIGKWLKQRNIRNKIILCTKGAHPKLSTMHIPRLSRDEIVKDLDESLQYLQTDHIDLYWLHRDDVNRPVGDILEILNEQVKAGKIRYFGCSNWNPSRIKETLEYSAKYNLKSFVANQMMWSFAIANEESIEDKTMVLMNEDGFKLHSDTKLTAIPYSSQARGFFSKAYIYGLDYIPGELRDIYFSKENIERFERLKKLSKELFKNVGQLSMAYLTSQKNFLTMPIIGSHTKEQLADSMAADDVVLNQEEIDFLKGKRRF
ncbi:MAG: aldo/keto reductase [Candidatus Parvarchaeota archaeon]|nr:aldo/keto reductase [Candidatus Jingweiarchaeum tengchongense]